MQNFRRWLAALASVIVGAASFALSYVALSEVAVGLGAVPASLGWLVPIVIDGGVICGSAVLWSQSKESANRSFFPYFFVAALVLVSVVVNMSHAGPSPLAKVIAALPPLILLGTLELVASQGRSQRPGVQHADTHSPLDVVRPPSDALRAAEPRIPEPLMPTQRVTGVRADASAVTYDESESAALEELEQQFAEADPAPAPRASGGRRATRVRAQAADSSL